MEIRFKFRSSSTFDTIHIHDEQQPSISISDLKSRIVSMKHLNLSHDFDLIFSDFVSGQEFTDENTQIPSGSSVIIKRVPAKEKPSPSLRASEFSAGHLGACDTNVIAHEPPAVPMDFHLDKFDDGGVELCSFPDANLSGHAKMDLNEKKESCARRSVEDLSVKKLEAINPTQLTLKGFCPNERDLQVVQSKPKTEEQINLDRTFPAKVPMDRHDMPPELKCLLCTAYLKEAVMIPCCQQSFCDKCVRQALMETARCPMCSSAKCKPEDLLPNISLRQAIERMLDLQHCLGTENNLDRYAPDGESGIELNEMCYAAMPRNIQSKQSAANGNTKLQAGKKCEPVAQTEFTEFQGENEPQNVTGSDEEANSWTKKMQGFHGISGPERNFIALSRPNKGLRSCYMCGSPDHLIRDCPAAASSHINDWNGNVLFQGAVPAYAPSYWPGSPPQLRPFLNMCGGPGMMMYNNCVAAATPYALPPYASFPHGGHPVASGSLRPEVLAISSGINFRQMGQADLVGLKGCTMQQKRHIEDSERQHIFEQDHHVNKQHDYAERCQNQSGDSFARKSVGKHRSHECSDDDDKYSNFRIQERISHTSEGRRVPRNAPLDEQTPERAVPGGRILPLEERHQKTHRTYRSNEELKAQRCSGSSQSQDYYYSNKERFKRSRMEHDEKRSDREYYSHSGSGRDHSYSSLHVRHREDEPGFRSRHSKTERANGKDRYHDRGKMTKHSHDDNGEDYRSYKRKRYL